MNPLVFLIGCIGTRVLIAWLAYFYRMKPQILQIMGTLALIPAIGFLLIYFMGWRKTGPETSGKPIWWNSLRPVHGILYLCFAFCALHPSYYRIAWIFLALDVMLGFGAYLYKQIW